MLRFDELRRGPAKSLRLKQATVPAIAASLGLALAGCSADFLRFDSPVFGLNGDKTAIEDRSAPLPADNTLYSQRDNTRYAPPPVASVSRSSTPPEENYKLERVASAAPITSEPAFKPRRESYAPATTGALPESRPAKRSITVQSGDTLYQLSRRHGVSVAALRRANGLTGNVIQPGQKLVVPGAGARVASRRKSPNYPTSNTGRYGSERSIDRTALTAPRSPRAERPRYAGGRSYTIQPGDSLYAISRRTGVSVSELTRLNGITNARALKPGARLALGRGDGAVQAPATRVASRTDIERRPTIKAKPIRTLPITRSKPAPIASNVRQPRILNQRPSTPIATKPRQQVALAAPTAGASSDKFRWPARGRVISEFNHTGNGVKNDGVNIALPLGTKIGAAQGGVVAYAGSELKGYGNLVLLRHDNGWVSAYAHASEVMVKRGDRVKRGQIIAKAGRSGGVTQPQLHFELRKGAKPVNPRPHMAPM